jgi:hypothetical protein
MVWIMTTRQPLRIWIPVFTCLALSLAGCASRAVAPVQAVQTADVNIKATRGVIVAARPAVLNGPQGSIVDGVSGVLGALHESVTLPSSVNATEYVIQRSDGTPAAMVILVATPAGNFTIGEQVEIIDGAEPALVPAN